ncbi:hypothetical protein BSPWISOXPB_2714 [uncultured Gammaproteobacteria bacterium]|nr:hypothetical protein BSPWISOXPB_2714 [uncultured Gammaproteobacteria bacterium]
MIRPWKSRLGLIYIENRSSLLDLQLIIYTVIAIISKPQALKWVVKQLIKMGADTDVVAVSMRKAELQPSVPLGVDEVVTTR